MTSKALSLLLAGLLAVVYPEFRPAQARERVSAGATPECELISRALDRYRVLAAADAATLLPVSEEPIEPGEYFDGAARLVRLLTLLGDLSPDAVLPEPGLYDGELVSAVERFQARHGLEPDGRIGAATLEQLNTPLSVRVHQLALALERWRRLPYNAARPAIVLNLPEFRLRAYSGGSAPGDKPDIEMKVVVGHAPGHKSPLLSSYLETVIFRPYWNVPASIQHDELLPDIERDPSWVRANNFELVTAEGEVAGDGRVSGDLLAELSNGRLQLRQKPGPKNTLGLVKFLFPNEYGIYLHDTSAKSLFAEQRRDFSHGCIRLEKPEELAAWVLRGQAGWSRDRIDDAIHGTETISVKVRRPVQLVIMYSTAAVQANGEVDFFPDIYQEDRTLEKELAAQRRQAQ